MKNNKNNIKISNKLDISNEKYNSNKICYKIKNTSNKYLFAFNYNNSNNNYTIYQNIIRNKSNINKKGYTNDKTNNNQSNIKLKILNIQNKQKKINNNKYNPAHRDCNTPDINLYNKKYNIVTSSNKKENTPNNSLLKSNIKNNITLKDYHFVK